MPKTSLRGIIAAFATAWLLHTVATGAATDNPTSSGRRPN
jgi:hypothetical protein